MASAKNYGEDGAKAVAINQGAGSATGSAIALGEGADAKSDALAKLSNASSSSLAQRGGDATSNAFTQQEGMIRSQLR